jgi:hypothetical protein
MRSRLAALVLLAAVATTAAVLGVAGASPHDGAAGLLSAPPCENAADFNRNARIDSVDALLILQCSAGLRSCR